MKQARAITTGSCGRIFLDMLRVSRDSWCAEEIHPYDDCFGMPDCIIDHLAPRRMQIHGMTPLFRISDINGAYDLTAQFRFKLVLEFQTELWKEALWNCLSISRSSDCENRKLELRREFRIPKRVTWLSNSLYMDPRIRTNWTGLFKQPKCGHAGVGFG